MSHKANQLVPGGGADFWPDLHICQWGKYLKTQRLQQFNSYLMNEPTATLLSSTDDHFPYLRSILVHFRVRHALSLSVFFSVLTDTVPEL